MPNEMQIQETNVAKTPAKYTVGSQNHVAAQATQAVELAETALTQALNTISQQGAATNTQAIQQAMDSLMQAEEMLDQAETNAVAANLPKQP